MVQEILTICHLNKTLSASIDNQQHFSKYLKKKIDYDSIQTISYMRVEPLKLSIKGVEPRDESASKQFPRINPILFTFAEAKHILVN